MTSYALVPLPIPSGWEVSTNHFFDIDLDKALAAYAARGEDPFDLLEYFNKSCLFSALRWDHLVNICLEWEPMGSPSGCYVLTRLTHQAEVFSEPPPQSIRRKRNGCALEYRLVPPLDLNKSQSVSVTTRSRSAVARQMSVWFNDS